MVTDCIVTDEYAAYNGDCVEVLDEISSESVDYSIFSPPFASLYTYSDSDRDMGNCRDSDEFFEHFQFLVNELFRVMKPGRDLSFHCMNLPTSKFRDGFIGINDFRGDLIRSFQKAGFIYHSEVTIWKDPVTAMQRTKAIGLLYKHRQRRLRIAEDAPQVCGRGIEAFVLRAGGREPQRGNSRTRCAEPIRCEGRLRALSSNERQCFRPKSRARARHVRIGQARREGARYGCAEHSRLNAEPASARSRRERLNALHRRLEGLRGSSRPCRSATPCRSNLRAR